LLLLLSFPTRRSSDLTGPTASEPPAPAAPRTTAAGPTAPAERHGPGSPGTTADPSTGARVLRPPAAAERPGGYRPTPSGADDPPRGPPPCVPAPPAGPRGARAPGGPRPTRAARHARRPG